MKPRDVTDEDVEFWSQVGPVTVGPMLGQHVGADDIPTVIRQRDRSGSLVVRVPWVPDDRDEVSALREGQTIWTTFFGGMLPTDVVIT